MPCLVGRLEYDPRPQHICHSDMKEVRGGGVGGIPYELVHGGNGAWNICGKHTNVRGEKASWLAAILIYLPESFLYFSLVRNELSTY